MNDNNNYYNDNDSHDNNNETFIYFTNAMVQEGKNIKKMETYPDTKMNLISYNGDILKSSNVLI